MKKRLFALASALILTFGMSVTVFAADSASAGATDTPVVAVSVDTEITDCMVTDFANNTCVASDTVPGASVSATTKAIANEAASTAKDMVGSNAAIATVFELNVPTGTAPATFTVSVPTVKAGQRIYILHRKADGSWEKITPKSVADGAVTFDMTSYSPIAIVIDNASETTTVVANQAESVGPAIDAALAYLAASGTAPKTGDVMMIMAIMASICLAGSVVFTKKAVK